MVQKINLALSKNALNNPKFDPAADTKSKEPEVKHGVLVFCMRRMGIRVTIVMANSKGKITIMTALSRNRSRTWQSR